MTSTATPAKLMKTSQKSTKIKGKFPTKLQIMNSLFPHSLIKDSNNKHNVFSLFLINLIKSFEPNLIKIQDSLPIQNKNPNFPLIIDWFKIENQPKNADSRRKLSSQK